MYAITTRPALAAATISSNVWLDVYPLDVVPTVTINGVVSFSDFHSVGAPDASTAFTFGICPADEPVIPMDVSPPGAVYSFPSPPMRTGCVSVASAESAFTPPSASGDACGSVYGVPAPMFARACSCCSSVSDCAV